MAKAKWTPPPGYYREWRKENREHLSAYAKGHRARNPVLYQKTAKRYRSRHRDEINARRAATRLIGGLLTPAQYDALLATQKGACAICKSTSAGKPSPGHKRRRILCVDHDHEANRARGLLCTCCNAGLGYFRDRVDLLESAMRYLHDHKG
jgi:hypothetical protein